MATEGVEQVVGEIERVRTAHETAIEGLRSKKIIIPIENGVEVPQRVVEARIKAIRAQREASIAEHEEALEVEIADLRAQGREALQKAKSVLEVEYYRTIAEAGPKGAEWQEAEARAAFVKEDLGRQGSPADVVELYQTALAAGDRVGGWLYGRYGSEHLAALAKSADMGTAARAQMALGELEHLAWSGAVAARRDAERKLAELEYNLNMPQTRAERLEEAADWADRLGMSQTPEQIVDMGLIDASKRFAGIAFNDAPVPA